MSSSSAKKRDSAKEKSSVSEEKKLSANPAKKPRGNRQKKKRFAQYEQSRPQQLTFFELVGYGEEKYSHTNELYDFLPKYFWGKAERINGVFLPRLERDFVYKGQHYEITILPASVEDENGDEKYYYLTKRESLIEDAVIKLMVEGNGVFLDGNASVRFSLYNLQKELKDHGHSYSYDELKAGLRVLSRTLIQLRSPEAAMDLEFHPFVALGFKGEEGESQTYVMLSPLISKSIVEQTYRLLNYEKVMGYRSVIARQLHKRLSHHYLQASLSDKYETMLTTIVRDFGLTRQRRLQQNWQEVEKAILELKDTNVILNCHPTKIEENKGRKKLLDVKISIQPHPEFIAEMKKANAKSREIKQKAAALMPPIELEFTPGQ